MPPHPPSRHACFYACFCTLLSSCYHPATILFPNLTKFFSFFSACILQALVHNPNMIEKYTHIVLDEVHERSTDADFAMLVVRTLVANAPHVKIIVMSATMQGSLLVSYFEEIFDYDQVASPYFVGAKRYPVETYFIDNLDTLAEKKRDYWTIAQNEATMKLQVLVNTRPIEKLKSALSATPLVTPFAQKVCTEVIVSQADLGESILVFLPGIDEITHYHDCLTSELSARNIEDNFSVFVLHSQVPLEDQKEAFGTPLSNKIHVILATNIAESSITFPKLRIVVNFGIYRQLEYDSKRHISRLVKKWSSHASCAQRAGRVGRVFEGIAVHLFSQQFYEVVLPEFDPPEMLTAPLAKLVLRAKQIGSLLGIPSPSDFLSLALNPPSLHQMEAALHDLANLGAVASNAGQKVSELSEITLLGHFSLSLPVDLVLGRLILFGIFFGCPIESIIIAAYLSLNRDVFSCPSRVVVKEHQQFRQMLFKSMEARFLYDGGSYSDAIMVCNLFRDWITWQDSLIDQPEPRSRHHLVRQFAHKSGMDGDRMVQFESSIRRISACVVCHIPEMYVLHDQLQKLGHGGYRSNDLGFCEDKNVLRSLMAASFSHQLLYGVVAHKSPINCERKRNESHLKTIKQLGFKPQLSLTMRVLEGDLEEVPMMQSIVHATCIKVVEGVAFINFLDTTPKSGQCEGPNDFVGFCDLPEAARLLWQFGERSPEWGVDGVEALFGRPQHPCAVSWHTLSSEKERVNVSSWRNRTGCVLNFSCYNSLGVATYLKGNEIVSEVSAQDITVLPSLQAGPSAVLMVVAFQSLHADLHLSVDTVNNKIVSILLNSNEILLPEESILEADDIIRVNALREAISTTLRSSTTATIPMDTASSIRPLLNRVLQRRNPLVQEELKNQQARWEKALGESESDESDSDDDIDSPPTGDLSIYYPKLHCSLVRKTSEVPSFSQEEVSSHFWKKSPSFVPDLKTELAFIINRLKNELKQT